MVYFRHCLLLVWADLGPLYETLGKENLSYCLGHSEVTTCFCNEDTVKTLLALPDLGNLKNIISFDPLSKEAQEGLKGKQLNLFHFSDALKPPLKPVSLDKHPVGPETILTFSYTSGTTGQPKAAMISHKNLLCFLAIASNADSKFCRDDVYLSFLPLPHIMERVSILSLVLAGAFIAYFLTYAGCIAATSSKSETMPSSPGPQCSWEHLDSTTESSKGSRRNSTKSQASKNASLIPG